MFTQAAVGEAEGGGWLHKFHASESEEVGGE